MGITGFTAFLSTTFICLLYKADIIVGMPCLLLSSGSHLILLGLGQRFSSGQKILPMSAHRIRAPLFSHLLAKGSHENHLSISIELPHSTLEMKCVLLGAEGVPHRCFGVKFERGMSM